MTPASASESVPAPCEVLFPLFSSPRGAASIGRMLKGIDAGRLVFLRETRADLSPEALAAVDVARSLAHPNLSKLLALVRLPGHVYVASEYIPGVSLFELSMSVRQRQLPLSVPAAVHLIREVVRVAEAAQNLLEATAGVRSVRCIYADAVWIAEFGEVMLLEVGAAPFLTSGAAESNEQGGPRDLLAAALELFHLVSGKSITNALALELDQHLPGPLARLLGRAMGVKGRAPYASTTELLQALDDLPDELTASEDDARFEIQRVLGATLEARRRKLELLELEAAKQSNPGDEEDSTRIFRAVAVGRGGSTTVRPRSDEPRALGLAAALGQGQVPHIEDLLRAGAESQPKAATTDSRDTFATAALSAKKSGLGRWWVVAVAAAISVGVLRWQGLLH